MREGRSSRTALGAALCRAAHQLVDRPLVLEDPLAVRVVGTEPEVRAEIERRATPAASALRAFIVVRSRFAEDAFAAAHARGIRQHVCLGAGLDTFACRCGLAGVRLVELDHPATQRWKRERLARAGLALPAAAELAPVDFERETLREGLARTRLELAEPMFVSWLGVTPYLPADAVEATLRIVATGLARGSEIVFDFAAPQADGPVARAAFAARVEAVGEPLRSTLEPADLPRRLLSLGFSRADVADAGALDARYLHGRADGLRLRGGHLMHARV